MTQTPRRSGRLSRRQTVESHVTSEHEKYESASAVIGESSDEIEDPISQTRRAARYRKRKPAQSNWSTDSDFELSHADAYESSSTQDGEAIEFVPSEGSSSSDGDDIVVEGDPNTTIIDIIESTQEEPTPEARPRRRRVRDGRKKKSQAEIAEENLKTWHNEYNIDWEESKSQIISVVDEPQPDELINVKMLPFQREGLAWLKKQEDTKFNGGILADSMGMGKTCQTISLIVSKRLQKPTLVVCPVVALYQWRDEIEKFTRPGISKTKSTEVLLSHDIVLTTYSVIESCFRKQHNGFVRKGGKVYEDSLIHKVHWGRIVLDEAHNIKDRSCSTARAVFALEADKRWSLSGTPLQNRVGELYSLIRFLRVTPYSMYYCKKCPCKSMTWAFSDRSHCDHCGHKPMHHFCWWNKVILKPIQRYGPVGDGLVAFQRLSVLLDQMMLRRTKDEKAEDLGLPPRIVEVRRDFMNEQEEDFYQSLFSESRTKFASYVRAGTVLNHYAHIFELLSKLRQAADHPFLVVHKQASAENPGTYVCGLCHDVAEDPISSKCKHVFCREDIRQYLESYVADMSSADCPVCFTRLSINLDQPELPAPEFNENINNNRTHASIVNRILNSELETGSKWTSSTKIGALLEELTRLREQDHTIKSIVFSQFVSFLDIVYWVLNNAGFNCVKLDGRMSPQQRDAVIKSFMNTPQITVFLVSLKAGGVALNLTEASRVFICDPWWNPAVEDQAMDRIHRLGQRRPVKITRLIVENSIESRIVQLQEKKHLLFQSTVGKDAAALERLTEEDLYFLFQM